MKLSDIESKKGISENYFIDFLYDYFGKENVLTNKTYNPNNIDEKVFSPDFKVIKNSHSIFIEIDEPYEITNKKTIHTLNQDKNKNEFYLKYNIVCLRYSEEQILEEPINCINLIESTLIILNKNELHESILPELKKRWEVKDVENMIKVKYRENLLNNKSLIFNI